MPKRPHPDEDDGTASPKSGNTGLLIAGGVGGGVALLFCCCGGAVLTYFLLPLGPVIAPVAADVIGRWENKEIASIILDLRADGTGTIEIPEAKVKIRITHKLQGNELSIAAAQGQNLGFGEQDAVDRLARTRVSRIGNQLRLEALAGPGQGQATMLTKIG